jgi:DNA-binding NtrC family response regulator
MVLTDLRMPREDGLSLASRLKQLADVDVVMFSGHAPRKDELERAQRLGLSIYQKPDLEDLIARIVESRHSIDDKDKQIVDLRRKVAQLELQNKEWTADLVSKLRRVPNMEAALISSSDGSFTVAELVKDIETLTPRGLEYIRLWRRTLDTLLRLRTSDD